MAVLNIIEGQMLKKDLRLAILDKVIDLLGERLSGRVDSAPLDLRTALEVELTCLKTLRDRVVSGVENDLRVDINVTGIHILDHQVEFHL